MTYLRNAELNYEQFSAHQGQVENKHFGDLEKGQKGKSWRNFIVYILFLIYAYCRPVSRSSQISHLQLTTTLSTHESSLIHDMVSLLASKFENDS